MFRDPRMRMVILGAPLIQMVVIAFALTTDVTDIRTAVLDLDNTPSSRELLHAFTASRYFRVVETPRTYTEMERLLNRGKVQTALNVAAGFERTFLAGRTASIQLLADGTDSNTTAIIFDYANQIVTAYSEHKLRERMRQSHGAVDLPGGIRVTLRAWFNPNLESRYYYVPSLIAVMLILVTMMLTSIAIVREKEIGTIEQVMVTPITRTEFIIGKAVPFMITGYITMTLMFLIAILLFDIRVQGSWLLLYALTGIYLAGNLGLALIISVSATTQQQALLTAFLILVPAILLSGFMFPIHNMPQPVQYATYLNPMRWYLEILRGVVIKGVGLPSLLRAVGGQTALAAIFLIIAITRFRKTMG